MYNRYIRRDDGTYTTGGGTGAAPAGNGWPLDAQPPPPPPDDSQ